VLPTVPKGQPCGSAYPSPPVAKNLDRWLGDGGMPLVAALGCSFDAYGDDADGWTTAVWTPTDLACNPHGIVQAGAHSVILDAAMNFALNAGLDGKDRTRATLELKTEVMRAAPVGQPLSVRGGVTRQAKVVAYAEAMTRDAEGRIVSRSTGTWLLHREAL
jgi:acyl-coenzyme A thioesterase PaaI-like protein